MDKILSLFDGFTIFTLVKILIVLLLGIYSIVAGLMVTQIKSMNRAVVIKDGFIMNALGLLHFGFAILVFLMAIFLL